MPLTTSSTLSYGIARYYDRRLMARAIPILVHYQLGQKGYAISLPNGVGATVYWTRYVTLSKRTTALTEATDGGITPVALKDMQVTVSASLYGNIAQVGQYIDLIHIDQNIANRVDLLAQNMGESVDYLCMAALHGGDYGFNRTRIDASSTYIIDSTATSGSTTTIVDSAKLGVTDNTFANGIAVITDPTSQNYGQVRLIASSTSSVTTVTVNTAFPVAISTETYRVIASTGLAASNVLTSAGVRYAVRELKRRKALKFDDGSYVCILPIDMEYDFMGDTTWVNVKQYSGAMDIYEGEVGKWMGARFVTPTTQSDWREAAGTCGTYSPTGGVYVAPFVGKEAFGVVDLASQPQKVYVRTWEQLGQSIPLYSSVGWEASLAARVLNGCFGLDMMCGATA